MKISKAKRKEIINIAAVSALSIAFLSTALMGANHVALAAATGGSTPIPVVEPPALAATNTYAPEAQVTSEISETSTFVPPTNLTVIESPYQHATIPSTVMSMEDAALVGAEYIWDVFGVCIDDMYVVMNYGAWASHTRQYWIGQVAETKEELIFARDPDGHLRIPSRMHSYRFAIDATTGERVDISYFSMDDMQPAGGLIARVESSSVTTAIVQSSGAYNTFSVRQSEAEVEERTDLARFESSGTTATTVIVGSPSASGTVYMRRGGPSTKSDSDQLEAQFDAISHWRSTRAMQIMAMDDNELMAHLGLTIEELEAYTQRATAYAERHFNNSTIANVMLGQIHGDVAAGNSMFFPGINVEPRVDEDGNLYEVLSSLTFSITDDTGRVANVSISADGANSSSVSIFTQQNDIIPGFNYDRPGLG